MMVDKDGMPVSIEVFKGNTSDPKTVLNQLYKLRNRFRVRRIIFV
jgi:transposase